MSRTVEKIATLLRPIVTRSHPPRWKRALVTGAASGIGEAIATQLAAVGVELVLVDKRPVLADVAGTEIIIADLCDSADLALVEQRLRAAEAPIDLVINNAGLGYEGPFYQQDQAEIDETIGLNVTALTRLTRVAVEAFTEREGGHVVLLSSMAALQPLPNVAVYAATKAYVSSLGEALYEEHKGSPVAVTTAMPGLTRTNFHSQGRWNLNNWPSRGWQDADVVAYEVIKATARRKPCALTSRHNWFLAFLSRKAPRGVRRSILGWAARRSWRSETIGS